MENEEELSTTKSSLLFTESGESFHVKSKRKTIDSKPINRQWRQNFIKSETKSERIRQNKKPIISSCILFHILPYILFCIPNILHFLYFTNVHFLIHS